jgi:hypothetical protein
VEVAGRPLGVAVLVALLVLSAAGSLLQWIPVVLLGGGVASLSQPTIWLGLAAALGGFAAAYGLWLGQRWARVPFLVCVLAELALGLSVPIALLLLAWATLSVRVVVASAIALELAVAALLVRYVWRHT